MCCHKPWKDLHIYYIGESIVSYTLALYHDSFTNISNLQRQSRITDRVETVLCKDINQINITQTTTGSYVSEVFNLYQFFFFFLLVTVVLFQHCHFCDRILAKSDKYKHIHIPLSLMYYTHSHWIWQGFIVMFHRIFFFFQPTAPPRTYSHPQKWLCSRLPGWWWVPASCLLGDLFLCTFSSSGFCVDLLSSNTSAFGETEIPLSLSLLWQISP